MTTTRRARRAARPRKIGPADAARLFTRCFSRDELEYLSSLLGDMFEQNGPCHCGGDEDCRTCETTRSLLRKLAPVRGVCMFCLCTEDNACETEDGPCSWADLDQTICSNPQCVQKAIAEFGDRIRNRTSAEGIAETRGRLGSRSCRHYLALKGGAA